LKLKIFHIDAFTTEIGKGNPAAVVPLEGRFPEDSVMQTIASENNLSETAFVALYKDSYSIRWFTPTREVDLCGHATLASAFVYKNHLGFEGSSISFQSASGLLTVNYEADSLAMIFPSRPAKRCDAIPAIERGLHVTPVEVLKSRDYLVILRDEQSVIELEPDFESLKLPDCLGVIVTAQGTRSDFVSRFFAPNAGIAEDPVTGSSHCTLIPYWGKKLEKKKMSAIQVSKRGGALACEDLGDTVSIAGKAVTYLIGEITIQ
jgi:PhzF family phenazine biosynthesis protein